MPEPPNARDWDGLTLKDRNEQTIGTIDAVYVDADTARPEWALVDTGGFGADPSFVPLAGAWARGDDVIAQVDATQVSDAPKIVVDEEISARQEAELFRHYGVDYKAGGSVTATAQGHTTGDRPPGAGDAARRSATGHAVTRSVRREEVRIVVSKERFRLTEKTLVAERTVSEEARREEVQADTEEERG